MKIVSQPIEQTQTWEMNYGFSSLYGKELEFGEITGLFGKGAPATFAMDTDVVDEALVFFFGPSALVGVSFLTAR